MLDAWCVMRSAVGFCCPRRALSVSWSHCRSEMRSPISSGSRWPGSANQARWRSRACFTLGHRAPGHTLRPLSRTGTAGPCRPPARSRTRDTRRRTLRRRRGCRTRAGTGPVAVADSPTLAAADGAPGVQVHPVGGPLDGLLAPRRAPTSLAGDDRQAPGSGARPWATGRRPSASALGNRPGD